MSIIRGNGLRVYKKYADVNASRVNETNYVNDRGVAILVIVSISNAGPAYSQALVDSLVVAENYGNSLGGYSESAFSFVVPNNSVYKISGTPASRWVEIELR